MLDGAMLLWWILTVPSFLFVVIDIWRSTPESPVLKWAFVILTAFTGPLGAFFYVFGRREPIRGTHDAYIAARWRQVLGSTMHCVAGDGIGIVVGAALGSVLALSFWPDFLSEYALGFGFGWAFFQAFAMRDMAGGSYLVSLRMTFLPELLSMNLLMTGMVLTSSFAMMHLRGADDPTRPQFLVHPVDGADRRVRLRVSDQLVAGCQSHETRHAYRSPRTRADGRDGGGGDGRHAGRIGRAGPAARFGREGGDDCGYVRDSWCGARGRGRVI
jgi:Domain of unknown function (DUF4396)